MDVFNVGLGADLARGMPLNAEQGLVPVHAASIIGNRHQLAASLNHVNIHLCCSGIQGVFKKAP